MNGATTGSVRITIEDNLESIFNTLKEVVLIHKGGRPVDIDFSHIRARGDIISSSQKPSEGPVTFFKIFGQALGTIHSTVKSENRSCAIISVEHPDLLDFINYICTLDIKVRVTPKFMRAVENQTMYELIDPHTQTTQNRLDAKSVFDILTEKTTQGTGFAILYPSEEDIQSALPFDKKSANTYEEILPPPIAQTS